MTAFEREDDVNRLMVTGMLAPNDSEPTIYGSELPPRNLRFESIPQFTFVTAAKGSMLAVT
jgi:hypothetical protein